MGRKCANIDNKLIKTSDRIFCMELPWAAFYHQGIDIDQNGWESVKPKPNNKYPRIFRDLWDKFGWDYIFVDGNDIINSENTTLRLC
jgi:hypothetical protein